MPRILITEDDRFMANVCREIFQEAGFEVLVTHDGRAAIEALQHHIPDVIMLDLMLPEIDGLGVLRFLRADARLRHLPVVVVSNSTYFSGVVQEAWQAGATHFINKGDCSPRKLVDEVNKVLAPQPPPPPPPPPPAPQSPQGWTTFGTPSPAPAPAQPASPAPAMRPPPLPRPPSGNVRVLLADDDRTVHSVIGFFLSQSCIELRSAQNGQEALDIARREPPDLLILDRNMPKMDGPAVLAAWTADPILSRIPVIVLSGKTGEAERAESLAGGAIEYLTKPFNLDDLVTRVLRAVGRS